MKDNLFSSFSSRVAHRIITRDGERAIFVLRYRRR